jgi:two-component system, sensor histidine kinase
MMVVPTFVYGHPPRPLRVLVADDNADATDSLAQLLELAGCAVAVAYEGFAVVPVADRFRPDVCVLDIRMPGLDGWEVARRLRAGAGGAGLLLIAVTGVQGQGAADSSADAGFDHHLLKPAHPADIFADLAAFIREALLCPAGVG